MANEKKRQSRVLAERDLFFTGQTDIFQEQRQDRLGRRIRRLMIASPFQRLLHILRQVAGRPADEAVEGFAEVRSRQTVIFIACHVDEPSCASPLRGNFPFSGSKRFFGGIRYISSKR